MTSDGIPLSPVSGTSFAKTIPIMKPMHIKLKLRLSECSQQMLPWAHKIPLDTETNRIILEQGSIFYIIQRYHFGDENAQKMPHIPGCQMLPEEGRNPRRQHLLFLFFLPARFGACCLFFDQSNKRGGRYSNTYSSIPIYTPCMKYLPTFTIHLSQM